MVDIVDTAMRSRMMSGIRGFNTKPERIVRSYLHRTGLRFRLKSSLPGKPDMVFPKYRVALFVHGCFWHRHADCRFTSVPSTNRHFWQTKFDSNIERDKKVAETLRKNGWRVLTIWACQLDARHMAALRNRIVKL